MNLSHLTTLESLYTAIRAYEGCPLKANATNTVIGDGNPHSGIVLIGEAPGAEEDKQGKPFVGRSGKLLDTMLAEVGLSRANVFITNTVFWRPPDNRPPTPAEVRLAAPFWNVTSACCNPKPCYCWGAPPPKPCCKPRKVSPPCATAGMMYPTPTLTTLFRRYQPFTLPTCCATHPPNLRP